MTNRVIIGGVPAPNVDTLLAEAHAVETLPVYVTADEYVKVIDELHVKGLTWKEIGEWFNDRKMAWSVAQLRKAHRDWEMKGRP